jgi:hypothetical protein
VRSRNISGVFVEFHIFFRFETNRPSGARNTNQPKSGAHVMTSETSHTTSIMSDASLFDRRFFEYRRGFVMAKYRSIDMAQRLSMDAVHRHTSSDTQMSHIKRPNVQVPVTIVHSLQSRRQSRHTGRSSAENMMVSHPRVLKRRKKKIK